MTFFNIRTEVCVMKKWRCIVLSLVVNALMWGSPTDSVLADTNVNDVSDSHETLMYDPAARLMGMDGVVSDVSSLDVIDVPETKEPEAEVFVEPETYDVSTMKLKTSELGVSEDGGAVDNELFEFEAFIKESDIKDGTAPFDSNDEAGNDSGNKNGIVRTFDSITYPIKITINPKKVDKLNNIVLKITGTLENGVTDGRVNAKFSVGGYEDLSTGKVGFEQTYTIAQTGNSVMIPINIEVQGAKNGVELKPDIQVEVVSVDGVNISKDNVSMKFDKLPKVTTSAKVNIKAYAGKHNYSSNAFLTVPYALLDPSTEKDSNIFGFYITMGVEKLAGKTDMRGATFPTGKINYHVDLTGYVAWDGGSMSGKSEPLKFDDKDSPLYMIDHQPIVHINHKSGKKNTMLEDKLYSFNYPVGYPTARSKMTNLSPDTIKKESYLSVWDSGDWGVSQPKIQSSKVTYSGVVENYVIGSTFPEYRADGWTGGKIFGVNDKVFATNSFMVEQPNEYMIGGKNNKDGIANNVYYVADVTIDSYVNGSGDEVSLNKKASAISSERNNPDGSMHVQNAFFSYPGGKELGTPVIGNGTVSNGDASTVLNNDVQFLGYGRSSIINYGGFDLVLRWNTDAFELTSEYAEKAYNTTMNSGYQNNAGVWVRKNKEKQKIYYGIAEFEDNSFDKLTAKGDSDYTWYSNYEEAINYGAVGAMKIAVNDVVGASTFVQWHIPLHVKTTKIGSFNENGTANIAISNLYSYPTKDRSTRIDVSKGKSYQSPSIWSESGKLEKKQSPVGSTVNFETLAVLNIETSSAIQSNKSTYYNSDVVDWMVKSSMLLPPTGAPDGFDGTVELKQVLPKGLDYQLGSGMQGEISKEPKVVKNTNGTTDLIWDLLVSKDSKIEDVTFSTTINPLALSSGVQSSLTIKNIISSPLDTRSENLRTTSVTITILKVGMVGIFENIDVDNGEKNSSFTVRMKPYTTIEDELDVKGLTVIPLSGDRLGSMYQGAAVLSSIDVTSTKPVSIYLNNSIVESNKPNQIDFTKNGWYKYTGKDQDISKALSLLFHVEGELSSADDIGVSFTVSTKDNNFGNIYYNETVINSATDYKLSPISNKVKYTIRADVELNLERLQIYTAKASEKLPVNLRVNKDVIKDRSLNEPLKLVLYDKEKNTKVYEKSLTIATLTRENELEVPAKYLEKNTNGTYEARIEGYNTDRIYVKKEADKIEALGYTAMEGTIERDAATSDKLEFKGVLMVERELGKELSVYYEQFIMPLKKLSPVKAGYGFALDQTLTYTNDLSINNVSVPAFYTVVDSNVLDGRIASAEGDTVVDLTSYPTYNGNTLTQSVSLPPVYVSQLDGAIFSEAEYNEAVTSTGAVGLIDGGNKLYTPIWISRLGSYDYAIKSKDPIGVNAVNIVVKDVVSVDAFMYDHIGSESAGKDELLIVPVIQDGEISGFDDLSDVERDWLNH